MSDLKTFYTLMSSTKLAPDPKNNAYFGFRHMEGKESKMHTVANPHVHLCQYPTWLTQ